MYYFDITYSNKIYNMTSRICTVDSKIDKNRCKKYKLIQVMGALYRYLLFTATTCSIIFTVAYLFLWKSIVLLSCTFEPTVIRDYLMAFWLSPEGSTRDPIISQRALARIDTDRRLILRVITKAPWDKSFITYFSPNIFFYNSETGAFFKRVYVKGICQKWCYEYCDANFKPYDVTIWPGVALLCTRRLY